jgi:hypothetical protein
MNSKLSLVAFSLALAVSVQTLSAQSPWDGVPHTGIIPPQVAQFQNTRTAPNWQMHVERVPQLLRMHCPALSSHDGLVVGRIDPRGAAALTYGLNRGDILLRVGEEPIVGFGSLPRYPGEDLTVMRAGQVITLPAREVDPNALAKPRPLPWQHRYPLARMSGVAASAFASGNESVSVAQNGDQITIEMSLPELESNPIRFQGTRDEITRDVESSKLSPAAQQRVLQAIR